MLISFKPISKKGAFNPGLRRRCSACCAHCDFCLSHSVFNASLVRLQTLGKCREKRHLCCHSRICVSLDIYEVVKARLVVTASRISIVSKRTPCSFNFVEISVELSKISVKSSSLGISTTYPTILVLCFLKNSNRKPKCIVQKPPVGVFNLVSHQHFFHNEPIEKLVLQ